MSQQNASLKKEVSTSNEALKDALTTSESEPKALKNRIAKLEKSKTKLEEVKTKLKIAKATVEEEAKKAKAATKELSASLQKMVEDAENRAKASEELLAKERAEAKAHFKEENDKINVMRKMRISPLKLMSKSLLLHLPRLSLKR